MSYECIILANPSGNSFEDIKDAVRIVNGLQNYFRCRLVKNTEILTTEDIKVDPGEIVEAIENKYREVDVIAITECYYSSGLIVEEKLPRHVLITCSDWGDGSRPPLSLFLIYSIASALITLRAKLTDDTNHAMGHEPPIGCIFDWWEDATTLNLDFVCARLCINCKHQLAISIGAGAQEAFDSLQRLLDFVRRGTMGATNSVPSKVWIVHGRNDDWMILKDILKELRVTEVDEFNEKEVVGLLIVDRWKQMLNTARFAFALITEDDRLADGTKQPRLNVAHEIGLCHARLGFEGTAILRQGKATVFNNLAGINYLQYEKGKLRDKKDDIKALLKQVGVIN